MRSKIISFLLILCSTLIVSPVSAEDRAVLDDDITMTERDQQKNESVEQEEETSIFRTVLFYLPNRILDTFDIFRARVRVGPGIAAGVRVTEIANLYAGSYVSFYAGLPGPRRRKLPRSPIGVESLNGAEISVVKATTGFGVGPDYSFSEIGVDAQLAIVGFAFGFDPAEMVDLLAGFLTIDLMDDDYK